MRGVFCQSMVDEARRRDLVFLTGDLGFKALEPLRDALGGRFINAGVAEQNMVSVGAGLARAGLRPWVYSIAPFLYARPFEQIRNDVCLHRLPVVLVGNGGGYGYGVMGATHHALEDYGTLLGLPGLNVYIPAFDDDVQAQIRLLMATREPAYLRLGLSELPKDLAPPAYAAWRHLQPGDGWTVLVVGPLAGGIWNAVRDIPMDDRPSLWLLSELPFECPPAFIDDLGRSRKLLVIEEHVAHGGVAEAVAAQLLRSGRALDRFETRAALGYPSGRYGSQRFHRQESGLDSDSIVRLLTSPRGRQA